MFKYYKYVFQHPEVLEEDLDLMNVLSIVYDKAEEKEQYLALDLFKGTLVYKTKKLWVPIVTVGNKIYSIYQSIRRWWMLRGVKPTDFTSDGLINSMTTTKTAEMELNETKSGRLIETYKK